MMRTLSQNKAGEGDEDEQKQPWEVVSLILGGWS